MQQRSMPNNNSNSTPLRRYQSPWEIIKSFVFRILMIYLVTRFFRQPATNPKVNNGTVPKHPLLTIIPQNLYSSGDLFVSIIYLCLFSLKTNPIFRTSIYLSVKSVITNMIQLKNLFGNLINSNMEIGQRKEHRSNFWNFLYQKYDRVLKTK